jgi:LuxR family transcriptional regulator, maltose regulon positive regulatory protein
MTQTPQTPVSPRTQAPGGSQIQAYRARLMRVAMGGGAYSDLLLKTTAPRAPRHLLVRPRLALEDEQFRDRSLSVVQAPPGFGKTSLLAQWRREHLARGAVVAWISGDGSEDPQHLLHGLVLAVRVGCGRPGFGRTLLEAASASVGALEGVTAWMAEVAQMPLDLVLMVDEAERLSEAGHSALVYLLHNTPPNLRIVVAARGGFNSAVAELRAYGHCVTVGAEMLRFRLEETMALVRNRFGAKVVPDTCACLHELTEGWPLGLQLALTAMERGANPCAVIEALSAGSGDSMDYMVAGLVAKLAPEDTAFLTRIAVPDLLHPDLCRALTGLEEAPERLARLIRDTPIFVVSHDGEWCRLHNLARDVFRARLAKLPAEQQAELHARAMRWLAKHGMIEEAARHAHAAGRREMAYDLAEQGLYDAVMRGHQGTVLDWLELVPETELDRRPRLRLAAAWALALGERHGEAELLVARILDEPEADPALRYECALIVSGAAYYADEPDRFAALLEPWSASPPVRESRVLQMHANRAAMLALLRGDPPQARWQQHLAPRGDFGEGYRYAARWGDFIIGLTYLWEGQVLLAEEVLRPALAGAEAELGRRQPLVCMLASLLAAAIYECDRLDEAAALLANRLDVLERAGTPDTVVLGYGTTARIAAAQGVEHRALDLLEALYAIGVVRRLPRLCVASLADQVRIHAGRFRSETCRVLTQRIEEILVRDDLPQGPLCRRAVELLRIVSHANAAIAAQNWRAALEALTRAGPMAETMALGRVRIEIMALRAYAMNRNSEDGRALLQEAMTLAQTYGLARTFVDAHPALADWARRIAEEGSGAGEAARSVPLAPRMVRPPVERSTTGPRAVPSMVLTPKEREVLELLARNLSNKEIALAMAVGEETVKWHLKNLFGKLDAGTRKHAVRRAQLLGLLEGAV